MESNVHTPWFQSSKFVNKTFFFGLSISVFCTNSHNRYPSVTDEMFR